MEGEIISFSFKAKMLKDVTVQQEQHAGEAISQAESQPVNFTDLAFRRSC